MLIITTYASLSTASRCISLFSCISNLSKALFQLPKPSAINGELLNTEGDKSFCCLAMQHTLQKILYLPVQTVINGYLLYHDRCMPGSTILFCFTAVRYTV